MEPTHRRAARADSHYEMRALGERPGPSPVVVGPQPHAQTSQISPVALQEALVDRVQKLRWVTLGPSGVSVPGARAFILDDEAPSGAADTFQTGREFAHLHPPEDGSLHMTLPAELRRLAFDGGWGEPHPISGTPLIFGPRNDAELEVVWHLLRSSYRAATGDTPEPVADRTSAAPVRLTPAGMYDSTPLGFSPVVVAPPGASLVFVSGQLAHDQTADFEHQVAQAFGSLGTALAAGGATPETVVKITCLVVGHNLARRAVVADARLRFFSGQGPASTIIPVPNLATDDALFEIDAVATVDAPADRVRST